MKAVPGIWDSFFWHSFCRRKEKVLLREQCVWGAGDFASAEARRGLSDRPLHPFGFPYPAGFLSEVVRFSESALLNQRINQHFQEFHHRLS